ncbi:MAG: putative DNA binding domain-containing protein [Bacilli bacterium]|nr:putative DNA binding domain-containing protein [Bacilli bacterium]
MNFNESDIIELKESLTDDIKKEIVAFANTNGGTIYIGIKDDGTIVGVNNPIKIMESVSSMIHDSISPDLTMLISVTKIVEDNFDIICIKVGKGINKPYYIVAKGLKPNGVYIRSGVTSIPSSENIIRKMIAETNVYLFENELTTQFDLTFDYANKYFLRKSINFNQENQQTLGLITKEGRYTNLGLILSDQSPYVVKIAVYQDETSLQFKTRKEFQGSILKIVDDVFDYFDIINQKNSKIIGYERVDQYDYPQYALREAFLNALVHRDYSYLGSTIIDVYSNRIEIISLGGITSGLNLEDILRGISETRNPKLANVFYRLNLIEAYGTGLKRIYESYLNYSIKPKIIPTSNTFTAILFNTNNNSGGILTDKQKILNYIRNYGSIIRAEVEQLLGVKKTTALNILNELLEENLIEINEDTKRARYYLKNKFS